MTEMTRLQQRGVRLPRTERRAQLLAAAQRVFAENGYHAAAMDEIAEYGIAAHALYKDQTVAERDAVLGKEARAYKWLRRTIETLAEGDNPEEFLEHTKLELFHDQVFCFTPKGLLITLPRSATPIDFAYAVHTDVGNHAVGCRINGRNAPLTTELRNGDEVEILTSEAQVPPPAWESLVVTGKARSSIRRATREAVRKQFAGLGRRIIERAFERMGKPQTEEKLASVVPRLARPSIEDVYAAVGRGELHSGDVVKAVFPDFKEETPKTPAGPNGAGWFGVQGADEVKFKVPGKEGGVGALPIRGLLFAYTDAPELLVAVQVFDGISAAVLGVMVPLVVADCTRGTGRFNMALGAVGTAIGLGAAASTTLSGYAGAVVQAAATAADKAASAYDDQELYTESLASSFASQSGVNVDEETAAISQLQTAYEAAAAVFKVVREMFDTALDMVQ